MRRRRGRWRRRFCLLRVGWWRGSCGARCAGGGVPPGPRGGGSGGGGGTARQLEAKFLPVAGGLVAGEWRARLRRAVIAADPEGAEQRRRRAERHAKVSLFGDDDGTAVLTGSKLPAIEAAAAMEIGRA